MSNGQKKQLSVKVEIGYKPEIGRWLWTLEDTRGRTKRSIEGINLEVIDWTATQEDNSVGTLLYHIAVIEMSWLYEEVLEKIFPPNVKALFPYDVRDDQGQLFAVKGISLKEHIHRLDVEHVILLESFRKMTTQEFRRLRSFEEYDVTPEWVIHHLIQHETEHCGQIMELRKCAERALRI